MGKRYAGSIKRLINSRLVRSVTIVASGTAGAQIISLAFSPVITRIYGPEAFGILGAFIAVLAVITPLTAFNYPVAIVLPRRDEEAVRLVHISILLGLANASLMATALWLWGDGIVELIGLEAIAPFMALLPIAMLLAAILSVCMQWIIRQKRFLLKANVAVIQSLIINSVKAGLGFIAPQAGVLILVTTLGSGLHAVMLFSRTCLSLSADPPGTKPYWSTPKEYLRVMRKYRDFVFFRTPQTVLNAASQGLPVVILAATFGAATAGLYALSRMVLEAPAKLLGHSVATVLYPRINEAAIDGENVSSLLFKATLSLLSIGTILFGGFIMVGPKLFAWAFGEEWRQAGSFVQWMALWTLVSFAARPCIAAIPVLRRERFLLMHEILSSLLRFGAMLVGAKLWNSATVAIGLFSIVNVFAYTFLIFVVLRTSKSATNNMNEV